MTQMPKDRGFTTVGLLDDLEPLEALAVRYLRMWCEAPDYQRKVWEDFSKALGASSGRNALKSFEALLDLCLRHARRPLMRHSVGCACLCADEACFATLLGYASEGQREDAFLMATALVRPDIAVALSALAEEVGLALKRIALKARDDVPERPRGLTLH